MESERGATSLATAVITAAVLLVCVSTEPWQASSRQEKYLQLFKVVKIPNFVCANSTGGVCVSSKDCGRLGGKNVGKCAQGYGICCLVVYNCTNSQETVTVNGSHLQSPPKLSSPNMCEYVLKRPDGVCQVRLDFNKFVTNDGTENGLLTGDCDTDMLVISGASNANQLGPLCGNLTGQHMYLDYGANSDNIMLDINTLMMLGQMWDIGVTYIKCNSPERAPDGCLQYFTQATGTVTSFNYPNGHQKNNEIYSICVKPLPGFSSITWDKCGGFDDFFVSGGEGIMSPDPTLPNITSPVAGDACTMDWVMIGDDNKYCGNDWAAPSTTYGQPFVAYVHFDGTELPLDDRNTGFCLMWMQGR